ncbi:MAG: MFS transporter [Patescibacteria group bacterium]
MQKGNLIRYIYLAGFIFYIPVALVSYINSSFLESYIGKGYVGLIYALASAVVILSLPKMRSILTRIGNRKAIIVFCLLNFLALTTLALSTSAFSAILAFVLYFSSMTFLFATLDVFIEEFGKSKSTGRTRGLYLTAVNLAWVLGQFISSAIIEKISFSGVYVLSAIFVILGSLIFVFLIKEFKDPEYKKLSPLKTIKTFLQNKNLWQIYSSNFILQFFYSFMVIYTPIYLYTHIGFGWSEIGIIFSIMLLPFVLLEYILGKFSDKIGEKEMLSGGFAVAMIFTFLIPFVKSTELLVWALLLFATRVGAAAIEVMNESYFFKNVKEEDADEISFFRNANPLAYIVAPLVATSIFYFDLPFKYIFFCLSIILFFGFLTALRLKDVR